jgi:hypothetical protein
MLGLWLGSYTATGSEDCLAMSAILCITEIYGRIEDLKKLLIDFDLKVLILGEAAISAFVPMIALKYSMQ